MYPWLFNVTYFSHATYTEKVGNDAIYSSREVTQTLIKILIKGEG